MDALFLTILEMSITASVVIAAILLIRLCLKPAPKVLSYGLWAVALFRLLCPLAIVSPMAIIPSVPEIQAAQLDSLFPALTTPLPTPDGGTTNSDIPTSDMGLPSPDVGTPSPDMGTPSPNVGTPIPDIPHASGQIGSSGSATAGVSATTWLRALWGVGVCGMGLWGLCSWLRLRRRLVGAVATSKGVWVADYIPSAFVLGLFRPKIYLPSALSDCERQHILLHEKHHIRRGDHVMKLLAYLALCLHWFNPLVWVAFLLAGNDMEMSCDEAVIRQLGADSRGEYAATLLAMSTGRRRISLTPLAFGEGDTKGRIMNLAKWKKPGRWLLILLSVGVCVLGILLLTKPQANRICIQIDGLDYDYTGNPITQIPEGSQSLGVLVSITHRTSQLPEEDFTATNLDEKYAGCPIYRSEADPYTIYLMDYSGVWLPFVTPVVAESLDTEPGFTPEPGSIFAGFAENGVTLEPGMVLVSEVCWYMNPLSSYAAVGGNSGMRYILGQDSFIQEYRAPDAVILEDTEQTHPKGFPVLSWKWQEFPWSDEEWEEICQRSLMLSDPFQGRLDSLVCIQVGQSEYLLSLDKTLYLLNLSLDSRIGTYIWSIYSLIPEESKGSAQWLFQPVSSAGKPAFSFRLDMDYTEVSAVCTQSPLMDFDAPTDKGYPTDHHLIIPAGRNLYWSSADGNGQPVMAAKISFTVHKDDATIVGGTIYITGEEATDSNGLPLYVYTARVVGTGLTIAQEEGGAVITFGK